MSNQEFLLWFGLSIIFIFGMLDNKMQISCIKGHIHFFLHLQDNTITANAGKLFYQASFPYFELLEMFFFF